MMHKPSPFLNKLLEEVLDFALKDGFHPVVELIQELLYHRNFRIRLAQRP